MRIVIGVILGFTVGALIGFDAGQQKYSKSWGEGYDRAMSLMAEYAKTDPQVVIEFLVKREVPHP